MNHQKIYNDIIFSAKNQNRIRRKKTDVLYVYYEGHHIIPRCVGGNDEEKNIVLLTAKEHFICHKLLTYIYPNNRKIILAFHMLVHMPNFKINISARDYAYLKELISKNGLSEEAKLKVGLFNKGKITSKETKFKQRIAHLGEKNPMFGKDAWRILNQKVKKCEYCGIETTPGNYGKWHGNRCKHKI